MARTKKSDIKQLAHVLLELFQGSRFKLRILPRQWGPNRCSDSLGGLPWFEGEILQQTSIRNVIRVSKRDQLLWGTLFVIFVFFREKKGVLYNNTAVL